jgi:N6-adenosine-specific RNA methylase IME4
MQDLVITQLDTARVALKEAKTIQATKKIVDVAGAAEIYAKRQQLGEEAIGYAHSVKIEALSQLGDMLKGMEKNTGARGIGISAVPKENHTPPTLAELGVDKKTSMVAQQLAAMPSELREEIANRETTLSQAVRGVNREVKTAKIVKANIALPNKVYQVLYADPPWEYEYSISRSRDIENQYPTMSLLDICELPVGDLVGDDAVLFLWVTSPKLEEGIEVLRAWGFTYRTCAVWDKEKIGMGYYFRQQHELLLVGVKGHLPLPLPEHRPSSVFRAKRGTHSEKPDIVIEALTAMYPDFQKLELFARTPHATWEAWGYEA